MIVPPFFKGILSLSLLVLVLSSCSSTRYAPKKLNKEFNYFQSGLDSAQAINFKPLTIKASDLLNIQVSSNTLIQEQAALFNAANYGGAIGNTTAINTQRPDAANIYGFLVDENGYIKYPMFGKIYVNGLTRLQLAKQIEDSLSKSEYVKDPIVQVRFLQLKINVLGEVKSPGTKNFSTDRITVLDAIGAAGDLTDRGRRDNVYVIREENGGKKTYKINLLNTEFLSSPANQLQQNDVVYVSSNNNKLKEVNFDPAFTRDLSIGLSILSGVSILTSLFILLKK